MINYSIDKGVPKLNIKGIELIGWDLNDMPFNYDNQQAVVFSNDQVDENLELEVYNLIKDLRISDFPENRVRFLISHISIGQIPDPIQKLPYPFSNLTISIKNGKLAVKVDTIQEKGFIDEDWDKKWTNEFYFDSISSIIKNSSELSIEYEKDDQFMSLSIEFIIDEDKIESAVNKCILKLEEIIKKVEHSINGLNGFFDVIEIWDKNKAVKNEKFWQKAFKNYSWILSIAINEPAIIFDDEAFLGGKNIYNKNGNIVDFLYKNKLSDNIALIEIKTPLTKIFGKRYRNSFALSRECSGAINQLLNYKDSVQKEFFGLSYKSKNSFNLTFPNCYLIIGSLESLSKDQKKCFEILRRNLVGIEILTFDEIFEKLFFVLSLIKANQIKSSA